MKKREDFLLRFMIFIWLLKIGLIIFICGCFVARLFAVKKKLPSQIILSLTYDQVSSNNGKDFVSFIFQERLKFKFPKDFILMEIRSLRIPRFVSKHSNLIVCRDLSTFIFVHLLKWSDVKTLFIIFLKMDLNCDFTNNIKYNFKLIKSRNFDEIIWTYFNTNSFKGDLVTTQTHLNKLPIYFKHRFQSLNRIMIWYSMNSIVIERKNSQPEKYYISKEIAENIDQHFIWNNAQQEDLESQGIEKSKLCVVGSIVFLPVQTNQDYKKLETYITYFDITPIIGKNNFYSEELTIETLRMILDAVDLYKKKSSKKIVLRIKPKREYQSIHSKRYLDYIQNLANLGKIQLLNPRTNLYNCVQESVAVLALPYSSPVFIAEEFGVPNSFVFNDNLEWSVPKRHGVEIQRSVSDLINWLDLNLESTEI